jgi:O-antigen ligase
MNARANPWGLVRMLLAAALLAFAWRVQDLFPFLNPLKPVTLLTGALLLLLLLDPTLPGRFVRVAQRPPALFAVIVGVIAVVGVPLSLYPGLSFDVSLKVVVPSVLAMVGVAATIRDPIDAFRFSTVHVIGALVFSLFVLAYFRVGPDGRLGDLVYYDANGLGLVLVCTLPLTEWLVFHAVRRETRMGAIIAIVIFLVTIVRTGSRGAFLGLVSIIAYSLFVNRSAPLRRRTGLAAVAVVLLVGAAGTKYWTMMDTIMHPTADYNWSGNSNGGRMDVWKRGFGYMVAHPITGVGAGNFPVAEGTISPLAGQQEYGVGLKWSAAHNSFVEVGAELGFPALVAFVAFLVGGLFRARRVVQLANAIGDHRSAAMGDALAASLVGYCVSGFFLSQGYSALPYSVVGIAVGLHAVLNRRYASIGDSAPSADVDAGFRGLRRAGRRAVASQPVVPDAWGS